MPFPKMKMRFLAPVAFSARKTGIPLFPKMLFLALVAFSGGKPEFHFS
jgi:hypothetical protein